MLICKWRVRDPETEGLTEPDAGLGSFSVSCVCALTQTIFLAPDPQVPLSGRVPAAVMSRQLQKTPACVGSAQARCRPRGQQGASWRSPLTTSGPAQVTH